MTSRTRRETSIPFSGQPALVRADRETFRSLESLLCERYPHDEGGAIVQFGWRDTPDGLVLTLAKVIEQRDDDVDRDVSHIRFMEPYLLRCALEADHNPLAVGVVHSHPEGAGTEPSWIDDDMDEYLSRYFASFAPNRPYPSLVFAFAERARPTDAQRTSGTGRIWYRNKWHPVGRFAIEGRDVTIGGYTSPSALPDAARRRVARLTSAFGIEAAERLARATVAVIGAGGTGSPALEVLARAGVGNLISIDPDVFEDSNLERVHGSDDRDVSHPVAKVAIALRHVRSIRPECKVTAIRGALPQREVVDAIVHADAVVGCSDGHAARLALSDIAFRYSVPALDCSVALEGAHGVVTGQISRFIRFSPADPCALCQRLTDPQRVSQELMHPSEQARRRVAAKDAATAGGNPSAYWRDVPQINTVGYLTAATGAMAAGYVIGWITRRFEPPFVRLEMNWVALGLQPVDATFSPSDTCICRQVRGWADCAMDRALVGAPDWWDPPLRIESA